MRPKRKSVKIEKRYNKTAKRLKAICSNIILIYLRMGIQPYIHNLCNMLRRGVREMPRFTEGVWAHEKHPVHMTVRFFGPVGFQYLPH